MIDELADLLLGARCAGCGRPGLGLCPGCRMQFDEPAFLLRDAIVLRDVPVWAAGHYRGAVRQVVSAHKDRGALGLTGVLAQPLVRSVDALLGSIPVKGAATGCRTMLLVPVPSSPAVVRQRGFDHSGALARRAARGLRAGGHPVTVSPLLRRSARVHDQSSLGRAERVFNQEHSMRARPCPPDRRGEPVVLVDDLCTTGASLAEGTRALRAAGWTVLGAAVVAHVDTAGGHFAVGP